MRGRRLVTVMHVIGNPAEVLDLVSRWSAVPSDPLLSEYTRLAIAGTGGKCWITGVGPGIVTLVPTQSPEVGLVEVATEEPAQSAATFLELRDNVTAAARASGLSRLEVIDRGRLIQEAEATVTRAVRRMKLADPGVRPGATADLYQHEDLEDLLTLINEAFEGHPENGNWTMTDLRIRFDEPWFDPAGLFVLRSGGGLAGFCWCKIHPDGVGEIYLIAMRRGHDGKGSGRQLLDSGVRFLKEQGCPEIIVYTELGNKAAERLYGSAGFVTDRVDRRLEIAL